MGHEADNAQKNAGRNLRGQRDIITKGAQNTNKAKTNLINANRKLDIITMRSIVYVGSLYGIAAILFLIIVCLMILKIKNI
mmetsp:Transcript_8170/g.9274  ORF Transcript_8170/g.9274 Transcript_8170/m.9274 type:complete len:81 (-) Transcript_8170:32-274(-)